MFGIGTQELIIILVIALVIIGPKHLPDMAKALGRGIGEFRRATNELKKTIDADDDLKEITKSLSEAKEEVYSMVREEISEIKDTTESLTKESLFADSEDKPETEADDFEIHEQMDDEELKAWAVSEARDELKEKASSEKSENEVNAEPADKSDG
ncbi:MAG: twin-arginine translocase TatA/TatE family subunit [Deltaproteobacteria bacterium]|nr:twin-arginine translocase TatA/TatE family subunit [Deltaproteobacteria bacterium]MBW2052043.1 twin-arginine translocase TatA/TatE family subunit [Deltaproteobacteria bacterium]MBW2141502.1 twin-arginine translocase TatA/TatE family subunit [Deltaproteobacteria bacterium]MBW2323409.1 twin-arginine translocase TatA/TatE family subunit [Deltaproteobacteria bacterium]